MQILEASMLGLRSARMVYRHRALPSTVTLFPMVHVGEQCFYERTYKEAFDHDVILVEGIRSSVSRHLTRSYRWLDFQKLGLAPQPKIPPQAEVPGKIVNADLSAEEFHREWRKVSFGVRALFYGLAPLIGIHRRLFASRERLARNMSLEDRRSAEEALGWTPALEQVDRSLIHARDERLLEHLARELDTDEERRIAVIYGAHHMRAVVRDLTKRGFYCSEASWSRIFAL